MHAKLWAPKIVGVQTLTISGLPFGGPKTKCHLDVGLVERHRVYYKGEGGGFPQVRAMMSLADPNCPWLVLTPKVPQLYTNHICVGFLQVRVSSWSLSILPSPIPEFQHGPLPLQSAANQGVCFNFLLFWCFQFGLAFESLKELGAHHRGVFEWNYPRFWPPFDPISPNWA